MQSFGHWLAHTLHARQMSQADLARRMGVSDAAVSRWRRGEDRPSPANCRGLARALGVPFHTVLRQAGHDGEDDPAPDEPPGLEAMFDDLTRLAGRLKQQYEVECAARGVPAQDAAGVERWLAVQLPEGGHASGLQQGDLVLIDRSPKAKARLKSGTLALARTAEGLRVLKVTDTPGGQALRGHGIKQWPINAVEIVGRVRLTYRRLGLRGAVDAG